MRPGPARSVAASLLARAALWIVLLGGAGLAPSTAHSGPCDLPIPELSEVPRAIPISPDGSLTYTVRILGCYGPIRASRVNVLFNTVGDSLVCWCNSSPYVPGTPHSFFANTNSSGIATFHIAGGGCIENQLAAIPGDRNYAAEVFADFVKYAECGVVSPDAVDNAGRIATDTPTWDPAGSCAATLADAVAHTTPLANSAYAWCSDINGDAAVTLSDAVILTPYLAGATNCAGNAGN